MEVEVGIVKGGGCGLYFVRVSMCLVLSIEY